MSDDSYTEEQARLDVYEFIAKNPNTLNLGKSELIAEIESFKHEKYKKQKSNADYCRENRAKKRKLAQANTQQQQRVEKLSAAERQKQCHLRKKAEKQQQASDAQANTQRRQRVSRPEIEAEDDDDYVFQVKRTPYRETLL